MNAKKLQRIFEGRTLFCEIGTEGKQGYKKLAVSGDAQADGSFKFSIVKTMGIIPMTITTKDIARVLEEMKSFAPKQASWRLSRKAKEQADDSKAKTTKTESAPKAEPLAIVAKVKGRG